MQDTHVTRWSTIVFALVFPSLVTLIYFVVLAEQPAWLQQGAYLTGKTIQFVFPALWVFWVLRQKPMWPAVQGRGLMAGSAFGLLVMALMLGLYFGFFKPAGLLDQANHAIREKVLGLELDTVWKYAAVGFFYALCHSLMEEYYWRWFVFGRLRLLQGPVAAICISSLGFMAHHVILLATFFSWSSPWTYLFSFSVAVGGAVWAWLYERDGSLYGPWISHLFVDAAIFLIGYDICRDLFT